MTSELKEIRSPESNCAGPAIANSTHGYIVLWVLGVEGRGYRCPWSYRLYETGHTKSGLMSDMDVLVEIEERRDRKGAAASI